mgnify:FL=1|tara:strand:+ start:211 stop:387 length:177 start_codon:yes stop_codon:yes gene_type:complete
MKLEQLNKEIKKLTFNELLEVYNMIEDATNDEDQTRYNERIKEKTRELKKIKKTLTRK